MKDIAANYFVEAEELPPLFFMKSNGYYTRP